MKTKLKTYGILFLTFLKIGLFTFGGGYAMISIIEHDIIEKKHWMKQEEISDIIAISESTPGPISINSATFIGYRVGGIFGSIAATVGLVIPSLIIIYIISFFFDDFLKIELVQKAFLGIQCAVIILILNAAIKLRKSVKANLFSISIIILVLIASFLISYFSWNFSSIFMILIGALIGLVFNNLTNRNKKEGAQND